MTNETRHRWIFQYMMYEFAMVRFFHLLSQDIPDDEAISDYKSETDIAWCYQQACAEHGISVEHADAMRTFEELRPN
jgi:hypothetical protein